MSQTRSNSGQSALSRVQSHANIIPPITHLSPPIELEYRHDSSTSSSDPPQPPSPSHVADSSINARFLGASSALTAPWIPTGSVPVVNPDPIAPETPPVEAVGTPQARVRRKFFWLVWCFFFDGVQVAFIIDLLMLSHGRRSTSDPRLSEWSACDKPLGIWDIVWAVKLCFDIFLAFWSFRRARALHLADLSMRGDVEYAFNPSGFLHSPLRRRLSILSTAFSIVWFTVTNVILFSSVSTCRLTSPHLWWLTFGLLAVIYLTILPFFIMGAVFFVIIPFFFMILNTFLVCTGRVPLQLPNQSAVGKLSKSTVNRIPLVIYIPPPPEEDEPDNQPIEKPKRVYERTPGSVLPKRPKRRFAFLRTKRSRKGASPSKDNDNPGESGAVDSGESWEDNWEHGKYPFVRLEDNRATCAICLMDFEEPKRLNRGAEDSANTQILERTDTLEGNQIEVVDVEHDLKLEDAGEGAQPLRLLACGHVFHQTCLDPWLTGVSGRCPMCQQPVEIPGLKQRPKRAQND